MRVVIRDDDTCGFTRSEEIRSCYEQVWNDVPISLSVTPFRIPGDDRNLPESLKGNMNTLPLHENQDIVQMLREGIGNGRIDISMHGYHHLRHNGLPEYQGGDELEQKTRDGRTYLEELLNVRVLTFVPPNNSISPTGITAVASAGMNLVNVQSLWSRKPLQALGRTLMYAPVFYWHEKIKKRRYPYVLDLGDHKEVEHHTVGPGSTRKQLFKELDYCDQHNGVFVLSTHYHAFDRRTQDGETVRSLVFDLIDSAIAKQGVEFLGINSIW